MADSFFAFASQHLNVAIARFFRTSVNVLVESEILIPLKRLRVFGCERVNVGFFYQHIIAVDRRFEFMKRLGVVVFTDSGIDAVVPIVNSAKKVVAFDMPVAHQSSAMEATSVEHRDVIVVADNDEVDFARKCIGWLAVLQLAKRCDLQHFILRFLSRVLRQSPLGESRLNDTDNAILRESS